MLLGILIILLACYALYCVRWRLKMLNTFKRLNIPGPPPRFLWGNMLEIYKHGHLVMQKKWHEEYGPVVGYFFGLFPVILIADTELLKKILLKDFHSFADRSDLVNGADMGDFNDALLVLKGKRWKEVRSTLTPSFTSKKLKMVTPELCLVIDEFMKNVDQDFANATECDLYKLYQALTLDTICKTGMGVDFGVQKEIEDSEILKQAKIMVSFQIDIPAVIVLSFPALFYLAGKLVAAITQRSKNSGKDPVASLKKQCGDVVRARRSKPELSKRLDLLQLMIDAQTTVASATNLASLIVGDDSEAMDSEGKGEKNDNPSAGCPFSQRPRGLTDGEVIDNAFLLLLAGYETTSSALAFLTKMLLRFPEVQEKVRQELLEATEGGKVFDFERLQRCQYTEAVIQETLRMYPPVYFLTARSAAEQVNYGSITIPKGMNVFSSVKELHYNEEVFPSPHEFQPERFLPENKTPAMAWCWQPFGAGPRNCIGMRFAQMEMKLTIAKLLTKYRISSPDEPQHDSMIRTIVMPVLQQIADPLTCKLELL